MKRETNWPKILLLLVLIASFIEKLQDMVGVIFYCCKKSVSRFYTLMANIVEILIRNWNNLIGCWGTNFVRLARHGNGKTLQIMERVYLYGMSIKFIGQITRLFGV